ncbi:hypothetical protein GOBAR_DD09864 [Gossypium barbadense]|nr:hypothetical protein GOBAR_DD09864 [Gossypium barbadense]
MNKKEILKLAKGFRGRAKNCIRIARERVEKALQYSYRDRRNKKRDMRSLWIQRINAGTRQHGDIPWDYNKIADCIVRMAFDTEHSLKVFTEISRKVIAISVVVQGRDSLALSLAASLFLL